MFLLGSVLTHPFGWIILKRRGLCRKFFLDLDMRRVYFQCQSYVYLLLDNCSDELFLVLWCFLESGAVGKIGVWCVPTVVMNDHIRPYLLLFLGRDSVCKSHSLRYVVPSLIIKTKVFIPLEAWIRAICVSGAFLFPAAETPGNCDGHGHHRLTTNEAKSQGGFKGDLFPRQKPWQNWAFVDETSQVSSEKQGFLRQFGLFYVILEGMKKNYPCHIKNSIMPYVFIRILFLTNQV